MTLFHQKSFQKAVLFFLSYGLNYLISSFKIEVGLNKAHNPPVGLSSSPWAIFSIHLWASAKWAVKFRTALSERFLQTLWSNSNGSWTHNGESIFSISSMERKVLVSISGGKEEVSLSLGITRPRRGQRTTSERQLETKLKNPLMRSNTDDSLTGRGLSWDKLSEKLQFQPLMTSGLRPGTFFRSITGWRMGLSNICRKTITSMVKA